MTTRRPSPTPRAQLSRVVLAAGLAVAVGAGPAVAWDLTSQAPRAEPRSPWPKPSPWLSAGKELKAAAGGVARVYLPLGEPSASAEPIPTPAAAATASVPSVITVTPPPRITLRPAMAPIYVE